MHAPRHEPKDGLVWKAIHNAEIQDKRHIRAIPCGPKGTVHDYVPFYFGYHSPMMLQLHTGQVSGYTERQDPLIYLVCHAQDVAVNGLGFVLSDGQGIAAWTDWFDSLTDLNKVDWKMVAEKWWTPKRDPSDPDRQRRKQAEFLVHKACPWGWSARSW